MDTYRIANIWSSRVMQVRFLELFRDGLLKQSPALAEGFVSKISSFVKQGGADIEIIARLREFFIAHKEAFGQCLSEDNIVRAKRHATNIGSLLQGLNHKPNAILDIGCGPGAITNHLSEVFDLSAEKVFGVDINNPEHSSPKFQFLKAGSNNQLDLPDQSVDTAFAMMSLHHVQNLTTLFSEMQRVLAQDGKIFIRETDAQTQLVKDFNTVIDQIFDGALCDKDQKIDTPPHFRSQDEWMEVFEDFGWRVTECNVPEAGNVFSPVWMVLENNHV